MADRNIDFQGRMAHNFFQTVEGMSLRIPISSAFDDTNLVIPSKVDPFVDSAVQQFPLGTELWYNDRIFKYALNGGTALAVGRLTQSVVPLAGHIDEAIDEPAVGATTIGFTPLATPTDDLAANALADGYILINDDTGEGYLYRIKSHPAITGATSGVLTLFDPLVVAPGANATATVYHNRHRRVIIHPSPPTAPLAGFSVCAVAANRYCWLQTDGPCPALTDGTVVIGQTVMASDNVDGSVEAVKYSGTTPNITEVSAPCGVCLVVNIDTEFSLINAKIV